MLKRAVFSSILIASVQVSYLLGPTSAYGQTTGGGTIFEYNFGGPPSSVQPGDILVDYGNVGVTVPLPGTRVIAEAILAGGSTQQLDVTTSVDGAVTVSSWGPDSASGIEGAETEPDLGADAALMDVTFSVAASHTGVYGFEGNECLDDFRQFFDGRPRWTVSHAWYFKRGSAPDYLAESSAINEMILGNSNLRNARNNCERADRNNVPSIVYDGKRDRGPNITVDSKCTNPDSISTNSFGNLRAKHVGYFCGWAAGNDFFDTDVKLNRFDHKWFIGAHHLIV